MKTFTLNEKIGITVAITIIFVILVVPLFGLSLGSVFNSEEVIDNNEENMEQGALGIEDTIVGDGAEAVVGKNVTVHYTGTLEDGTVFDSSIRRNDPFSFDLGAGQVIAGWDQGVRGMKVGGKRTLTIPPELGYGESGIGPIPGGATLIFEVELLEVGQ